MSRRVPKPSQLAMMTPVMFSNRMPCGASTLPTGQATSLNAAATPSDSWCVFLRAGERCWRGPGLKGDRTQGHGLMGKMNEVSTLGIFEAAIFLSVYGGTLVIIQFLKISHYTPSIWDPRNGHPQFFRFRRDLHEACPPRRCWHICWKQWLQWWIHTRSTCKYNLIGGLEHVLFSHILGIIIPID